MGTEYGIHIHLIGGQDKLILGNYDLSLEINLLCDNNMNEGEVNRLRWDKSFHGTEDITMQSLEGCPRFTTNQLFIFMDYIKTILALVIVVPASFLLVFGREKIFISSTICSHLLLMYAIAYALYTTILRKNRHYSYDGVAFVIVNAACAGLSVYLAKM